MTETSQKRVALITGGGKGIGAEVSHRLAAAGHHILIGDLDQAAATALAQQITMAGFSAQAIHLDVGNPKSIDDVFTSIDQQFGRCDILVNCAGIAKVFSFLDFPLDNFLATMNINVTGTLLCAQAAARLMVKHHWGRIVNIASVAGMRAVGSGRTAYGTSKGAVIALTRQMAVELAEHGITANAVSPGPVDTPMTQVLHTEQFRQEYSKAIPMNRYGTCGEIASAVMYLVSEEARYVTGISMPVDGGFMASGARGL